MMRLTCETTTQCQRIAAEMTALVTDAVLVVTAIAVAIAAVAVWVDDAPAGRAPDRGGSENTHNTDHDRHRH